MSARVQGVSWGSKTCVKYKERKPDRAGRTSDHDADLTKIQSSVNSTGSPTAKTILRRSPIGGRNSQALESHHHQSLAGGRPWFQVLQAPQPEAAS